MSPDSAMSPLSSPPPPAAKARANTHDGADGFDFVTSPAAGTVVDQWDCRSSYPLQRAASSEARLPSPTEKKEEYEDDNYHDWLSLKSSLSLSRSYDEVDEDAAGGVRRAAQRNSSSSPPPSLQYSKTVGESSTLHLQQQQQQQRTITRGSPLQTIESEKCLVDLVVANANAKPPKRPWSASSASSSGGSTSISTRGGFRHSSFLTRGHRQENNSFGSHSHEDDESMVSHYSVDAGKHGFLSNAAKLHLGSGEGGERRGYGSDLERGSSDSVVSGGNDSLVFKYKPGEDTPPAEYTLPASILKVYGDTDLFDDSPISSDKKTCVNVFDDRGRAALSSSSARTRGAAAAAAAASNITERLCDLSLRLDAIQSRRSPPPPPTLSSLNMIHDASTHSSTVRTAHMIALIAGEEDDDDDEEEEQERILPYHERKQLMKRRAEEKRREKIAARISKKHTMPNDHNKSRMLDTGERRYLKVDANGYGATNDDNLNIGAVDVESNMESTTNSDTKGWFQGLVALVTGQEGKSKAKVANDKEDQITPNSYRKQADAFLRRTERERMMMKKSSIRENTFNGGHRARRSTGSSVLVSIASCSDDDDNDTDGYETCSSDELSNSSYQDNNTISNGMTPIAPARVWKYGEPPTITDHAIKASKRDRVMRRERLLQEEYDYKLHDFKKRHEATSKRFRVFVLITVAIIFVGILGFAFAVCVRMLTSLQ